MGRRARWLATPYAIWMALFTIIPLIIIVYYALTDNNGVFTFSNVVQLFEFNKMRVFWNSLWQSAITTVVCLIIGYPVAYCISRMGARSQSIMITLLMIPMSMSFLLRTMSLVALLEYNGPFYRMFMSLGIENVKLIGTPVAVIIGMVYNYLPYMILPLYTVMVKIEKPILEAAGDLGAGKFNVFSRVILPLSKPGIISGVTMVFVPAVSTFYIAEKLGGTDWMIGDLIEQYFKVAPDFHFGAALSLLLMLIVLISIGVMSKTGNRETAVVA